jgi:hypothetical protein
MQKSQFKREFNNNTVIEVEQRWTFSEILKAAGIPVDAEIRFLEDTGYRSLHHTDLSLYHLRYFNLVGVELFPVEKSRQITRTEYYTEYEPRKVPNGQT